MGILSRLRRAVFGSSRTVETSGAPLRLRRRMEGTYDAAREITDHSNYWSNADRLDADSANSRAVREKLVARSRYEVANNGYVDGMTQTHANFLVGIGPSLRMQSGSEGFNQAVEVTFWRWMKATHFRRKLWLLAHAKLQDGEGIAVLRSNPAVRHPVQLDILPVETELCQTPMLPYGEFGYIDGIKFDEFGNPLWYDILTRHPGGQWAVEARPQRIPAQFILHWLQIRRPGQHRGVPELRSTLNAGASSRRWREATVGAAETAADISLWLETQAPPDDGPDSVAPFSTIEFEKRMAVMAPMGWQASQMRAEHPNAQYEAFLRAQISEQGRPKCMPYNMAAADSSTHNYASGRLDFLPYFLALDVEREDGNDSVLDPLFRAWWPEAVRQYGWNADIENPPDHAWDWPKHPVPDVRGEAGANEVKLKTGQTTLHAIYTEAGLDWEDEVQQMAEDFGVSVEDIRRRLLDSLIPEAKAAPTPTKQTDAAAQAAAQLLDLLKARNGNGRAHEPQAT